MAKSPKAWNPKDFLAIQDICLWSSTFSRHLEYQAGVHGGRTVQQERRGVEGQQLEVTDIDGEVFDVLRALVSLGTRSVYVAEGSENPDDSAGVLYEIVATFAVSYKVVKPPPEEELQQFFQFNCIHNVWPFWRQHVFSTLKSASLPLIEVPFFSGREVK